jgi:hypothetical protein
MRIKHQQRQKPQWGSERGYRILSRARELGQSGGQGWGHQTPEVNYIFYLTYL